jgi:hypothetical protein
MRLALATALVVIVLPATAKGQSAQIDALSLQAGAHARILANTTGSKYELITVVSARPDSLRYSLDPSPDTRSLAWQQISEMDASIGRHTNVARGTVIGFLVGFAAGATGAALSIKGRDKEQTQLRWVAAVANGLLGGALGGIVGAVIGSAHRTEDWVPVTLPRTPAASSGK